MQACCAAGCQNKPDPASNITFYRIPFGFHPFQQRRRELWVQALKIQDWTEEAIKDARICSAHFISGKASVDSGSPDFVPSVFATTNHSPKSQTHVNRSQRRRKSTAEALHAVSSPTGSNSTHPAGTKKRKIHNSAAISPQKSSATPEKSTQLTRPAETFSKAEIQELVKQEILATLKQSEHKMDELIKRIQKADPVSKYQAVIARLQADIKKIKRREQVALACIKKLRPVPLAPSTGHDQQSPGAVRPGPPSSRDSPICILDPPSSPTGLPPAEPGATESPAPLSVSRMEAEGETGGSADASEKDEEVVFCGVRLPRKRIVEGFWQRRLKRPKVVDLTEDGEVDTDESPVTAGHSDCNGVAHNQSQNSMETAEQQTASGQTDSPSNAVPGRTTWCSPPRSPGRTARPPNPAQSSERATPTHPPASRPPASLRSATSQVTSPQLTSSDSQQPVAKDTPHSSPSSVQQEDWRSKLPPLPATPLLQQPLPPAAAGTNAPQQVELTVARIRNPKGIGALWRVERPDPRTAKVRQYHLYALHEDRTGRVSSWRNVGTVPSLPLPMACKLTDHGPGRRFCFTVISEDVYGRYGPYSQIQSIVPQD